MFLLRSDSPNHLRFNIHEPQGSLNVTHANTVHVFSTCSEKAYFLGLNSLKPSISLTIQQNGLPINDCISDKIYRWNTD